MQMKKPNIGGTHKAHWITISTDEYESMKSTIEVLSDPELMDQIRGSLNDIESGRVKNWDEFKKELELE